MNVKIQRWKRNALLIFGWAMIIGGVVENFIFASGLTSRTVAISMIIAGVLAFSALRLCAPVRGSAGVGGVSSVNPMNQGPVRVAWLLSAVWIVALLVSYLILRDDVQHGGHVVWPVYAVAISGLGGGITWSYVLAKIIQQTGL